MDHREIMEGRAGSAPVLDEKQDNGVGFGHGEEEQEEAKGRKNTGAMESQEMDKDKISGEDEHKVVKEEKHSAVQTESLLEKPAATIILKQEGLEDQHAAVVSESQLEKIEIAAAIGELEEGLDLNKEAKLIVVKEEPVSHKEASVLQGITANWNSGRTPHGSVASHVQSAADRGGHTLEIPVNKNVAAELQSLTARAEGKVAKGSFAAVVQSVAGHPPHTEVAGSHTSSY